MTYVARTAPLGFALCIGIATGACSIDPKEHQNYRASCDAGSEIRVGNFCILKPGGSGGKGGRGGSGGGGGHAEPTDGGPDATSPIDDGGIDSGLDATMPPPPMSCDDPDASDYCYPFDAAVSTSLQPPCRPGTRRCGADHLWSTCSKEAVGPKTDVCDGVDNDCDGKTDEAQLQMSCKVGGGVKGVCAEDGVSVCHGGKQDCIQFHYPSSETCDGVDNDCDGKTDEDLETPCYGGSTGCTANQTNGYDCVPASTCAPGKLRCIDGHMQTECTGDVRPATEVPTQQNATPLDEDCDGMIDEGFTCANGQQNPCYTGPASTRGKSPCKDGMSMCMGGHYGPCMMERTPQPETCMNEGMDDDCDGTQDNVPRRGTSCSDVSINKGACKANATWQCQAASELCQDGMSASEVCDGLHVDEDCDGNVDEGFNLQTDKNNCGSCGNRCGAGLTCCGGGCVNIATSNSNCGMCGSKCGAGQTCCSSSCVNLTSNGSNCGTCGQGCLLGCSNGHCNLL